MTYGCVYIVAGQFQSILQRHAVNAHSQTVPAAPITFAFRVASLDGTETISSLQNRPLYIIILTRAWPQVTAADPLTQSAGQRFFACVARVGYTTAELGGQQHSS